MPITGATLHVSDIARSVDFYVSLLDAEIVDTVDGESAELDFVDGRLHLLRLREGRPARRHDDDLHRGFRHIGFKVADVYDVVPRLEAAGVEIFLGPGFAEFGGVNLAFFRDPDGTVLEVVDGPVRYADTFAPEIAEWEQEHAIPARPRFDHIAQTCQDLGRALTRAASVGFHRVGQLRHGDERGFTLDYLRAGNGVLEVFTFARPTVADPPVLDAFGFVAARIDTAPPEPHRVVGTLGDGSEVYADEDDLAYISERSASASAPQRR